MVIDASAVAEALVRTARGARVHLLLRNPDRSAHAPTVLDYEVLQALRGWERRDGGPSARWAAAVSDLGSLPITRYPITRLAERIWELRHNITAYDASYVALAEALDVPLVTCDARLAAAPGHTATIELITA